jgi:hypothetical protein
MTDADYLHGRLVEAKQAREDYEDGNPVVQYCLGCDEIHVLDETGGTTDCSMIHNTVTEDWTHAGLSEWIYCLEYIGFDSGNRVESDD